jgi:hypothetical protein
MAPFLILFIFKIIHMKKEKLEKLFKEYEKAFDKLDLKTIAEFYAPTFISAGPKGTIPGTKQDASNKAEDMANFYRNIGHRSGKILSKKIVPISDDYTMVTVHWGEILEKTGDKPVEFDISYIVQETEADPKIILFITHEDEQETMKKLGFQQQVAEWNEK